MTSIGLSALESKIARILHVRISESFSFATNFKITDISRGGGWPKYEYAAVQKHRYQSRMSASSFQNSMAGNVFYIDSRVETVVDPQSGVVQNQLLDELQRCDHLVQLDLRYANLVAGASKMPMNMIWSARNQDESVSDTDLAALKDLAWNEFVKKRYLPSVSGSTTVGETAASMLEIVQNMHLQRRRFQIMGLHEQVEASEIHLILHLRQASILDKVGIPRSDRNRNVANRFRRHDRLFEPFALAVGAFVCSSAPYTLGAATTRYERDLQFEYRKNATALFVHELMQIGRISGGLEEDYVARVSRLIVIRPDDGGKSIGLRPSAKSDDDDSQNAAILNSVAVAQNNADKAWTEVVRIKERVDAREKVLEARLDERTQELRVFLLQTLREGGEGVKTNVRDVYQEVHGETMRQIRPRLDAQEETIRTIQAQVQRIQEQQTRQGSQGASDQTTISGHAGRLQALEAANTALQRRLNKIEDGANEQNQDFHRRVRDLQQSISDTIQRRLDAVDFDSVQQRLSDCETALTTHTQQVNREIAAAERLGRQNGERMDAFNDRLDEIHDEINEFREQFESAEQATQFTCNDNLDIMKKRFAEVQQELDALNGRAPVRKRKQPEEEDEDLSGLVESTVHRILQDSLVADITERVRRAVAADILRAPAVEGGGDLLARVQALERLMGTDETTIPAEYAEGDVADDALYRQ